MVVGIEHSEFDEQRPGEAYWTSEVDSDDAEPEVVDSFAVESFGQDEAKASSATSTRCVRRWTDLK